VEYVDSSVEYVDIVKDVINLLPVYYICGELVRSLTISFLARLLYGLVIGWSSLGRWGKFPCDF
jgi:hypothetical protein